MHAYPLSPKNRAGFYESMSTGHFESRLEIPSGNDPDQNAWLTITANYTLNFVDSKNQFQGLTVFQDGKLYAQDSNKPPALFPIQDWDMNSRSEFIRKFAEAESFWNYKFLLITPRDYGAFDFTSLGGLGWICRPNVICLFKLKSGGRPNHLPINVVRTGTEDFRSDEITYDDQDVDDKTLWHKLGHALDQDYIKALLGDVKCLVDVSADGCSKEPSGVPSNIQGSGTGLLAQNAETWHELIAKHTDTAQSRWQVSLATDIPPRKMPIGFNIRGVMPPQW